MTRGRYERTGLRPEVEQLLAGARAQKATIGGPLPVEALRATNLAAAAYFNAGAPAIPLEREITIPGADGQLRALVYAPVAEPNRLPVVLHLHGGGFVFMLPESFARPWKEIALAAGVVVVSLDYRLAPAHPYPAGLDDCVAVFRWLRGHAAELGGDPNRLAIAGESAGGGLAASTTLRLVEEGERPPDALAVACAWLDLRNNSPAFEALAPDDPLLDAASLNYWRECYAPRPEQWLDPRVSPVLADLRGFPQTCVVVGDIDPLCEDGVTFAKNLRAAGVDAELHEYEGMPHIFWVFPPLHGLTDATARIAAFLRRTFAAS